jgi:hypothetical protein
MSDESPFMVATEAETAAGVKKDSGGSVPESFLKSERGPT